MAEVINKRTTQLTKDEIDEIKIIRAARRDPRAFGELYKIYVKRVFRYLFSRIGNINDTEDVTAQTFLAAFESFNNFRRDRYFAAWLFTIARNKAMDYFRHRGDFKDIEEIKSLSDENDPLEKAIQTEQVLALSKLIHLLPEEDQELLRLRFLASLNFQDIAHCLHCNKDAVKKSTYRLLERLQKKLEVSYE